MKFLKRLTEFFLLVFVFLLPWQVKLILRPDVNNFNEISLYASHLALLLALILFLLYQLINRGSKGKVSRVWYFLGALEVLFLLSFFVAQDKLLAAHSYFILLGGLGMFYMLREGLFKSTYKDPCFSRVRAIYVFLISVFFHASLGIYQFLSQKTFAFKYLGLADHSSSFTGSSVIETASGRWLRAYGGLDHPNILGGVLVLCLLLTSFLLVRKKIINTNIEMGGLAFLFVSYFVSLTALFFTFSRASWLALFIGFIVLFISIVKKEGQWVKKRFLILMLFSLVLFIFAIFPYRELVFTRFKAESRLEQISLNERSDQIFSSFEVIKENPLLGVGTSNYVTHKQEFYKEGQYVQPVHNSYLLLLAESGIFAVVSLLLFFFFLIKEGRRQTFSLAIIVALLVLMFFEHWFFSLPFGILFFFFILGVI